MNKRSFGTKVLNGPDGRIIVAAPGWGEFDFAGEVAKLFPEKRIMFSKG